MARFFKRISLVKKVKFVQSIAGSEFSYAPGAEHFVDSHTADAWIADGICVAADDPKELRSQIADLQSRLDAVAKDTRPAAPKK